MTFTFLDGPIDSSVASLYFTSDGLAVQSSYTIDNSPVYLGDYAIAEGTGLRTPLGGGLLRINGAGSNHNPDLYRFDVSSISSITVNISQIRGDGAGFAIGVAQVSNAVPEPASLAIWLSGMLGMLSLTIRKRIAKARAMLWNVLATIHSLPQWFRWPHRAGQTASLLLLLAALSSTASGATYDVINLGTLGGSFSYAQGINNSGQVVGYSYTTGDSVTHAFLYSSGTMIDLGILGGTNNYAQGINDSGQVVGHSNTPGPNRAFLHSSGATTDLGTLGGAVSIARGINNSGQVVGQSYTTGSLNNHAFLYSAGAMTDLGTLGGTNSIAYGINDSEQVVGYSNTIGNSAVRAFLYSSGIMTDLGTLGGTSSHAFAINDSGQVVGYSQVTGNSAQHAFLYSAGIMTDLGTLGGTYSVALGINDSGQVVGYSDTGSTGHAFLYSGGTMTDLNSLIDPLSGWTIYEAQGINNAGQIVAYGYNPEIGYRALLLTLNVPPTAPVPEPASLAIWSLFGAAVVGGGWRWRWRKRVAS